MRRALFWSPEPPCKKPEHPETPKLWGKVRTLSSKTPAENPANNQHQPLDMCIMVFLLSQPSGHLQPWVFVSEAQEWWSRIKPFLLFPVQVPDQQNLWLIEALEFGGYLLRSHSNCNDGYVTFDLDLDRLIEFFARQNCLEKAWLFRRRLRNSVW